MINLTKESNEALAGNKTLGGNPTEKRFCINFIILGFSL